MTTYEAKKLIEGTKGKIFTVTFTKRSDGTSRVMTCRTGVKVHQHGREMSYNPTEKMLIPVYDMKIHDYRTIPVEGIRKVRVSGEEHEVQG